ncbi:tail fiber domain-containing protein [Bacillus sp. ISTL8]|uniref:tail fiber domain-containing protein n=1 Tax=Bacillus sp. ISTL8 TaxID=2596896 RepID=UPI001456B228|nr:tail fiber domain-containing protein [Bacillus sp. ISTL8]
MPRYIRYKENDEWKYASVKDVGDLSELKTLAKTDVVTAINSLIDGGMADVVNEQIKQAELIKTAQDLINTLNSEVEAISTVGNELKGKVADMESEINSKVNVEDYEKEYKDVTSKLRDKADLTEFQKVGKDVDTLTVSVEEINGALEQKVNRTTYEHDLGLNKWVASKYEVTGTDFDNTAPSFALIKGLSAKEVNEFPDASSMVAFTGDNIITHYFTNVNLKDRKTVYFNVTHEDSLTIYMNGAKIYENGHMSTVGTKVALGFNAGWNTVDILHGNRTGAPVMNLGVKLSTQVDKLTAVIGVGDKNDARLREAETSLKQTEESIKIMATKNEVTELGNKVESQSSSMEVLSNAIKSKVETERFNEYSDRLETAESSVEIIEGKIVNLVEKKDFDELNGKYSTQQTKIEQMDKSIGLKASNEKVDKLSGRVEVAEGAIEVANDKISLTVTGLDNLGKKTTAIEQDTGQIKQSVTNLSKSVTAQGTAIEEHSTSITSLNKSIALKAEADKVYTIEQANGKIAESATKLKSEIEVTTKGISQTVTDVKKDVDGMKTTVESQGTQIKQTAEEVAVNVVKKGNVKTSINASAEGVKILGKHLDITGAVTFQSLDPTMQGKVNAGTEAKNAVDNLSVGGTQMIDGTDFKDATGWSLWGSIGGRIGTYTIPSLPSGRYIYMETRDASQNRLTVPKGTKVGLQSNGRKFSVKGGKEYILSMNVATSEIANILDYMYLMYSDGKGNQRLGDIKVTDFPKASPISDGSAVYYHRVSLKFTPNRDDNNAYILIGGTVNRDLDVNIGYAWIRVNALKIEEGNIATSWGLSQWDIDESIIAKVDNITVGGNNIISNSLFRALGKWRNWGTATGTRALTTAIDLAGFPSGFKFSTTTSGEYGYALDGINVTAGETYTLSAWFKLDKAGTVKCQEGNDTVKWTGTNGTTVGKWFRITHTFVAKGNTTSIYVGQDGGSVATSGLVTGVQLERGNKATDWKLSQSDIDEAIALVQGNVDNITVGGNNLLLNSHADYSTTDYLIATYTLTENWVAGQEYTFVIKGTVPAGQKFGIWMNGGSNNVGYATTKYADGITYVTFKAVTPAGSHTKALALYNYPSNTTASTVDWVALYKGNKPMDWTISSGDIQNLFTGVDEKAEASKKAIADMSNDNKATPLEKQQLKKEWATITAEKPNFEAVATTYGITAEKTNYVNSYNALNTAITPIISNAGATSDINGATFRNTFDDYYDKKAQLTKKINELARSIATGADSKAQQAKDSIADMSSDSKITPVEKVQLKKEWAVMLSEKPQYEALGTTYGITTEKTNYVNAYNTLNTVLNGTGGILTNMTTTSAVTGATFRAQFDDYYDKKAQLVKVINVKSKSLADSAQGTANTANNTINGNKATWDRASNINSNGTFNTSKLSGQILDAQISSASNWNGAKKLLDSWKSGTTLINGGMLANNSIFSQHIAIGDFTNLSQINEEKNPNGYPTVLLNNKKYFKMGNGAYAQMNVITNTYVEFKVNDEYYIAFNGYRDTGITALNAIFRYYYTDNTWENAGIVSILPTTADTRIARNLKITVPPNDTKTLKAVNLFFEKDNGTTNGYYYVRDIEVRKRYTGELVVDGSIKAQQLDVASLFAHTAFINSLKSQNVSADKIVGGTIHGVRYESINASNKTIKLVLEGNTVKSYGAMSGGKQNYAEMKDGGLSVFEMAESGSPFGDRKAYVEPARFNAVQGSRSTALDPTELRFWVPNQVARVSYDVTSHNDSGYGLRLEAPGGVHIKSNDNSKGALGFEAQGAIYFDGWGNIKGDPYGGVTSTWSIKDADGRVRFLTGVGKGSTTGTEINAHGGGITFNHNGSRLMGYWIQGANYMQQYGGHAIFKYQQAMGRFETRNGNDTDWARLAGIIENTSSRDYKKNISAFERSALDIINASKARLYHYNSQDDSERLNIGLIAEEAPELIQGKDGKTVDGYGMTTLAWKAIQELSEQVRYLKNQLNNR